ncbi:MAG: hypothetical protein NXH94_20800 [Rhodobacteraceae bacterium]|nr:hypothetical protein [Paracoccaceae bacterium]
MAHDALPDLIYLLNGRILGRNLKALRPEDAISCLTSFGPEVVFKADASAFGNGVQTLSTADICATDLFGLGNGVIQKKIESHPEFNRFGVSALTTLRIGTSIIGDQPARIRNCYLKIGRAKHTHILARDQVRVAVNWRTGALDDRGFLSDWQMVDRHPETGVVFAQVSVPAIERAIETVLALHDMMPFACFISWDLAIEQSGKVQVLEWEGGVVSFGEAVQGPCFSDTNWDRLHLFGAS